MRLKPVDTPELIELVADWMAQKENYRWLDFGGGRQVLTPEWLKTMAQRTDMLLRVYTSDEEEKEVPIGVVGLDDVNRVFRTARVWVLGGDKSFVARGYATRATSKMLTLGFRELGLHAITTWVVEGNPSIRVAERLGFRFIGRQRQCHYVDGRPHDRLWFDVLASEHKEIE